MAGTAWPGGVGAAVVFDLSGDEGDSVAAVIADAPASRVFVFRGDAEVALRVSRRFRFHPLVRVVHGGVPEAELMRAQLSASPQ